MKCMKKELRLPVEAWRNRRVTRSRPASRRLQQRFALLAVGPKHMVGDGDADAVGGCPEIVAGVEQPVAPLLPRAERAFDQMAFPIEIVGQDDRGFADKRASVVRY